MSMDQLIDFLEKIEPILLVVIPTCFGIYLKVKNSVEKKKKEIDSQNKAKNKEKFSEWEHQESLKVIDRIKAICNYYKDIGNMDLVNYIQFENGTMATSKICNMFLSCLAEDSRFGRLPKMIPSIQRVPYSRMSTWINNTLLTEDNIYTVNNREEKFNEDYSTFVRGSENVHSFMSSVVKDPNGITIGICSFFFVNDDFNGKSKQECIELLKSFTTSIETIFLDYHNTRKAKEKELKYY